MRASLKWPHKFIDTEDALKAMSKLLKTSTLSQNIAVDIEAFCVEKNSRHLGQVSLLQLCSPVDPSIYIVDVLTLGPDRVAHYVKRFMNHPQSRKVMYDCRKDAEAMSVQMGLTLSNVLDLQLYHAATAWLAMGTNRRSNLDWASRNLVQLPISEDHKAVEAAFSLGNRSVWDERPLPEHLLSYAANDVRHLLILGEHFQQHHPDLEEKITLLTQRYLDHYGTGVLTESDVDPAANQVSPVWLEETVGPGGSCKHCGMRGHEESRCFKKDLAALKCLHCGDPSHLTTNCFKLHPEKNKCAHCGQTGHTEAKCFVLHPCTKCGGKHITEKCNHEEWLAQRAAKAARDAPRRMAEREGFSRGQGRGGGRGGGGFRGRGGFERGRGGFERGRGGFERGRGGFERGRGGGRASFRGSSTNAPPPEAPKRRFNFD